MSDSATFCSWASDRRGTLTMVLRAKAMVDFILGVMAKEARASVGSVRWRVRMDRRRKKEEEKCWRIIVCMYVLEK